MSDYGSDTAPRRRSLLGMLALPLLAFIAGIALMAWAVTRWEPAARLIGIRPAVQAPAPTPPQPVVRVVPAPVPAEAEPQRFVIDPETTRRVALVERRIGEIESQSRAAAGNADRAEGLLVAFAARRALDQGVPLGYIEGLLRQRFGETQRQAVATIITASRQPVTLEELQEGLQEAAPQLTGVGPNQNWWTALKAELGGIVAIRKEGTPSTMPAERLRRATRRLESGQVAVALAEVLRMPGRENARDWIAKARRYVAARRALDAIETAALLEPHLPPPAARTAAPPAPARPLQPI